MHEQNAQLVYSCKGAARCIEHSRLFTGEWQGPRPRPKLRQDPRENSAARFGAHRVVVDCDARRELAADVEIGELFIFVERAGALGDGSSSQTVTAPRLWSD